MKHKIAKDVRCEVNAPSVRRESADKGEPSVQEYKRKARERLTSEKGLLHRSKQPIGPEAVFGQMKQDMHYKRFRHFGKDKVTMDFAFFAIAFNIKKMAAKQIKQTM